MPSLDTAGIAASSSWAQPLYQVYPPGMPGHQADKKWYGYDPARAKRLLAEAGFPNGFATTLYASNYEQDTQLMQAIQSDLAAVGVKAQIRTMSADTYYALSSTPHKTSAGPITWSMDFPDPVNWIVPLFSRSSAVAGGANGSFWWSSELEKMLAEAQKMTDADARIAKFREMQALIMDQAPYVTLVSPTFVTMHSKRVGGFYLHPVWLFDPRDYWLSGQ